MLVDVTPDLRRSLRLGRDRGAVVQDLEDGSPGQRAGLRPYDVIVEADGTEIVGGDDLNRLISSRPPGFVAELRVLRDGREIGVPVRLAERPDSERGSDRGARRRPSSSRALSVEPRLGLSVRELDRVFVQRYGIPADIRGVVVTHVDPAGPAYAARVRPHWIVLEVNRWPVPTLAEYARAIGGIAPGTPVALYCYDPVAPQRRIVTVTTDGGL
jgi:S1-C subfamily serine protease